MKKLLAIAILLMATTAHAKNIYWAAITDTNDEATTLHFTNEKSDICPAGAWHLAMIDGWDDKLLCWTIASGAESLAVLNVSTGTITYVYQFGVSPGITDHDIGEINREWVEDKKQRTQKLIEIYKQNGMK